MRNILLKLSEFLNFIDSKQVSSKRSDVPKMSKIFYCVGSSEHLRFCNFTVSTENHLGLDFFITAIDEDKAVLHKYDVSSTNISILYFSDCREVPVNLGKIKLIKVHPASNGIFDVDSWSEDYSRYFRTVVDVEGNIIMGNQRVRATLPEIIVQSSLKIRLTVTTGFVRNSEFVIQVAAVNYDGSTEILKEYPLSKEYIQVLDKYSISPTHDLLSVCTKRQFRVYCGQFDLNGVLKFNIDFTLAKSSREYALKAFNVPGGGLIVLLLKFSGGEITIALCVKGVEDYYIIKKFDNTGRLVGSLQLWQFPEYHYSPVSRFHFFENEKKEMCLSALDTRKTRSPNNQVTLDVACFSDKDLYL